MRMPKGIGWIACLGVLLIGAAVSAAGPPASHATAQTLLAGSGPRQDGIAPPSVQITSLNSCGCAEDAISISYTWTNLPIGSTGRLRVIVNGVVYEDTVSPPLTPGNTSGSQNWNLHFENGGGTATGTWPLPAGQPVEIFFTDEFPLGAIVTGWKSVLDSCSGTCVFSSSAQYSSNYPIPTTTTLGLAGLAALLLIAGVIVLLRARAA